MISGRVQGVGFRFFTYDAAYDFGITGWVRNNYNGSVELEAQGGEDQLERFFQKLKAGPPLSRVTQMETSQIPAREKEDGFAIVH